MVEEILDGLQRRCMLFYRCLQQPWHCQHNHELPTSKLIVWEPKCGRRNSGRPAKVLLRILLEDVESRKELASQLADWEVCDFQTASNPFLVL